MGKPKHKKHLIFVHSIKGGTGKTTAALGLAQYFGGNGPGNVCYIDTDIVGVGTVLLAGEPPMKTENSKPDFTDFVLLNPFDNPEFYKTLFEDSPASLFRDFVRPPDETTHRNFKAVFSSLDEKLMKRAIQATSDMFFSEDVEGKINILLEKLFGDGIDTIILDTSPGMQGLTQIIFTIAKNMDKQGKLSLNENIEVEVIHVCIFTNNFAHLRGLYEFLKNEKDYYFKNKHQPVKFLLVINQVSLGVEFKTVPEPSLYYDEYQLEEIKKNNPKVGEFAVYLKGNIEFYGLDLIHRAFVEYYSLKRKDFLQNCFELYEPQASWYQDIDIIGDNVVIIPEQPEIRRAASNFGWEKGFDTGRFFKLLEAECESGHLGMLGRRVKEKMDLQKEKK